MWFSELHATSEVIISSAPGSQSNSALCHIYGFALSCALKKWLKKGVVGSSHFLCGDYFL